MFFCFRGSFTNITNMEVWSQGWIDALTDLEFMEELVEREKITYTPKTTTVKTRSSGGSVVEKGDEYVEDSSDAKKSLSPKIITAKPGVGGVVFRKRKTPSVTKTPTKKIKTTSLERGGRKVSVPTPPVSHEVEISDGENGDNEDGDDIDYDVIVEEPMGISIA